MLVVGGGPAAAQDSDCAPVGVGDGTGVYFFAVGDYCSAPPEGFTVISHLVRDDQSSAVLVLVDAEHDDDETVAVAEMLTEQVKDGTVDGETWHSVD